MKIVLAAFAFSISLLAADPFVGVWKINTDKSSNTNPSADKAQIKGMRLIYEAGGDNSYGITWQRPDKTTRMLARLDGKDYSNDSDGMDYEKDSALPAGTGSYTMTWQRIDDRHQLLIFKKRGKEEGRRDVSISPDGKVLTFRQSGTGRSDGKPFDFTLVFDRE